MENDWEKGVVLLIKCYMQRLIQFQTFKDNRGDLTVIEKEIPFEIKRIFYIYNVDNSKRGFHKHKKTRQVAICISGCCDIVIKKPKQRPKITRLNSPEIGLLIEPEDYHWMENFCKDTVLLVIASESFNEDDYIRENED